MEVLILVLNIVLLECILSIDNSVALATMVRHLPAHERKKALRYGMIGAYVFRGLALFLAVWLIKFSFLKLLGGAYLIYLFISFFTKETEEEGKTTLKNRSFWGTVVLVEIMDMAFSIDNILAVVAMTSNMWAIIFGVFIGIAGMRYAAGIFSDLLEEYPDLEKYAFVVIGILGWKLVSSSILGMLGMHDLQIILESKIAGITYSVVNLALLSYPFIKKRLGMKLSK